MGGWEEMGGREDSGKEDDSMDGGTGWMVGQDK